MTYDFTGISNQPVNGATEFSGSFTIDSNPNDPIALPAWDRSGIGENWCGRLPERQSGRPDDVLPQYAAESRQRDLLGIRDVVPVIPETPTTQVQPYVNFMLQGS